MNEYYHTSATDFAIFCEKTTTCQFSFEIKLKSGFCKKFNVI